jgi:hypothetical protein
MGRRELTESKAAKTAQTLLEEYQKLSDETRARLSEAIPAVLHLLYLNGYEVVVKRDDA